MVRLLGLIVLFIGCFSIVAAQTTVEGILLDKASKEKLKSITVLLKSPENKIIGFKSTDEAGIFKITTSKPLVGAYLEINHLGYKKQTVPVTDPKVKQEIFMEVNHILLEDVKIKSRPQITRTGDTLNYNVSSFAKEEDRSIGEVLKRMPGIEVSESGKIKYQGKSISNFYIDGDDLLDDRYNIGSKTIPHRMVKDVQVLNNHEHLKVLKGKRFSDEVALNLVIKDEAKLKLTGQVKLGAGLPHQYDGELNTILFNKKYKGLNVIQGNNIGNSLQSDLIGHNTQNILAKMGASPINNLLSLGTVGNPPISQQHYLMNNTASINANNLFNFKKDWQLKTNIQGVFEESQKRFAGMTDYFSEQENFSFDEIQHTSTTDWLGALRLTMAKNSKKQFVNNSFSFESENEDGNVDIFSNGNAINLNRQHKIRGISNTMDYVPALKNGNIVQLNWFFNYGNKPQTLQVFPGVYPDIFNNGVAYNSTMQHVKVPTFFTSASAGYRMTKGAIVQFYNYSFTLDKQRLQSHIQKGENGVMRDVSRDSTLNDMSWLRSENSLLAGYEWRTSRLSTMLNLPVALQQTAYKDETYAVDETSTKVLFNPNFKARYAVGREDELSFGYQRSNGFGNIENVYRGLILRNYRTIANNSSGINENRANNFDLNYKLSKTTKLLFVNFGANYNQSISSTMISSIISNESTQTQLISRENKVNSYGLQMGFDKYIFALASNFKLSAAWSLSDYNQIFNNETLPFQNISYQLSPSFEAKIWKQVNASYSSQILWSNSRQVGLNDNLDRKTFNIAQNLGLPISLFSKVHVRLSARHLFAHQMGLQDINYVFFDTFVRYRLKKLETDLELNLTNIGNIKNFETYSISSNMQTHNQYELRGRMAVMKVIFNIK